VGVTQDPLNRSEAARYLRIIATFAWNAFLRIFIGVSSDTASTRGHAFARGVKELCRF